MKSKSSGFGHCKVCGVKIASSNYVDYRPGSCRDCELERKRLYSGVSGSFTSAKSSSKKSLKNKSNKKLKKGKAKLKKAKKNIKLSKQAKQKLLKRKKEKLKKQKQLAKIRAQREKKRKKLRAQLEKLRRTRALKAQKIKQLRRKQKIKERKEKERLKLRIRKAKERERKLLRKERERLKKEKEKIRKLVRLEKDRVRDAKRAEKDRIRSEKQRIRLEKQREKEKLKRAKEAAKAAINQAREAARQAAHEARRLREEAKKPPIVSVVTKLKELGPPPNVKVIQSTEKVDDEKKEDKIPRKVDAKSIAAISGSSASILESATVIPAGGNIDEERISPSNVELKKDAQKLHKDTDPIIDRYNPYGAGSEEPDAPRPPSPTPWLAPNFSVVGGDFKETEKDEVGTQGGLSEEQVKDIIEKVKKEHKRKAP